MECWVGHGGRWPESGLLRGQLIYVQSLDWPRNENSHQAAILSAPIATTGS